MRFFASAMVLVWMAWAIASQESPVSTSSVQLSPGNCEDNSAFLDNVRNEVLWGSGKGGVVIAIARLGKGERAKELNRRRLFSVQAYLTKRGGLPAEKIVTAEGEAIQGYGRVELYVGGKLLNVLLADRGKLLCVECCGIDESYYLYRRGKKQPRRN